MFLYVGNKNLFGEGGISIFRYIENEGTLEFLGTRHTDISAGFLAVDDKNAYLFCVNERLEGNGVPGGQVLCFRIDSRTGNLKLLSRVNTHTVLPCYLHYISDKRRLLVCNHAKRDWILKVDLAAERTLRSKKIYDDAALEVFDVTQDGIIKGPTSCWVAPHANNASDNPHLHSITYDAKNCQSLVCDTGSDLIYTLTLDDYGSPLLTSVVNPNGKASTPRYGVIHPRLPIAYFNSEKQNAVFVFKICENEIHQLQVIPTLELLGSLEEPIEQSAIAVNHAGTVLYTLIRKTSSISAFSIGGDGRLRFLQSYPVHYESPRALVITPDDKNMFVACSTGKAVVHIKISLDGSLSHQTLEESSLISPSSMALFDPRH